jgi:uncharacterized protein YndB with AHSA1/START domain
VQGNTISVERVIDAPAEQIFALIADAGRHYSFDGSGTVDRSTEPSHPLTLGSEFGMSMRGRPETMFLPYRTTNTVVEFEADRRIAWKTTAGPSPWPSAGWFPHGLIGGRIWRYELEPVDGASATGGTGRTLVRETWDISTDRQRLMLRMGSTPKQAEDGMRATLERIAALLTP